MRSKLQKSRAKTAPILEFFSTLAVSRQVTWPVSRPPALYLLYMYTQGIGFWEKYTLESWFQQKRQFASSIRGLPDPKNR